MPKVQLRPRSLINLMRARGWTVRKVALVTGLSPAQVSRVLRGVQHPGPKFISGWLRAVGDGFSFEDFFSPSQARPSSVESGSPPRPALRSLPFREDPPDAPIYRHELSPAYQWLLDQMQLVNCGQIKALLIRSGEPQRRPTPELICDVILGRDGGPRQARRSHDFLLKDRHQELFRRLRRLAGDYLVDITVQDGLPMKLRLREVPKE